MDRQPGPPVCRSGPAPVVTPHRHTNSNASVRIDKALFRFVDKVNHDSPRISAEDMKPLYAAGWQDDAIFLAITVCAMFNFYNRWIDASGVHALSDEAHRAGGKRTALHGYVRS
jgi:hypothetical protein